MRLTAFRYIALVVIIFILLIFVGSFFLNFQYQFTEETPPLFSQNSSESSAVPRSAVRIYIGIVTAWWNFGPRLILREMYTHFPIPEHDRVTIRFVVGRPSASDPGMLRFLQWEQERFQDLQMLNITENMDEGKSIEYFADLARLFPQEHPLDRPWDYAMKTDDDSLVNIPVLLEKLRPMTPRQDTYMGRGTEYYHMGAGYTVSWDLVLWLGQHKDSYVVGEGGEDYAIGALLHTGDKGKNFVNLGWQVMDHPSCGEVGVGWCRKYGEDAIIVHQLKNYHLQGDAIEYFLGDGRFAVDEGQ